MGSHIGNRDKILECAKELFYHSGYQSTSVDDILKRCGVAKSNFYYHFESKEKLALEVLRLRTAEYQIHIVSVLIEPESSPADRLERFFEKLWLAQAETQKMAGCPFGNFAAALPTGEVDPQYEHFRVQLSQLFREIEEAVSICLQHGIAQGEFRPDIAPAELAAFIVAVVQGLLMLTKTHQDPTPMRQGLIVLQRLLRPGQTN